MITPDEATAARHRPDRLLARSVAALLQGRRVAVAESCTAGRISADLAAVERAAEFFAGGITAYQEQAKRNLLGVVADSVLSRQAAAEMARGVAELLGVEVAVATTGVAGTDAVDGVEPGTVFVATLVDGTERTETLRLEGDPEKICDDATERALELLSAHLAGRGASSAPHDPP